MPPTLRFTAILTLLMLAAHAGASPQRLDPSRPMTQYVLSTWRDTTGLPVDSIASMAQTPDGYLWLATEHGIVRFDGVRFTVFTTANTPALLTNDIFTLFVSSDGTLWAGTRGGGAVKFDGSRFLRVPIRYRYVVGFAESGDSAVWIGAPGGLVRAHGGTYRAFEKKEGYPGGRLETIAADATGAYVALEGKVIRVDEHGVREWTTRDGLSRGEVRTLRWTSRGLLAGNDRGDVDRLSNGRFEHLFRAPSGHGIASVVEGAGDSLWMATIGGGLLRYSGGRLDSLTEEDGLTSDSLTHLLEDDEGNLWAGTVGGGLVQFAEPAVTALTLGKQTAGEWILSLAHDGDGDLWFTTNGGRLYRLRGTEVTSLAGSRGLHPGIITTIVEGHDGSVWIGAGASVQKLTHGRIVATIAKGQGLEGMMVNSILPARNGIVWVATEAGLHRIEGGRARKLTKRDGMTAGTIVSIREAADGSLWLAKPSAIEHFVDGRLTCFTWDQGLRSHKITSLAIDEKDGSVWAATMGNGLLRIREGRVRTYRASDGLPHDSMYGVVQDRYGSLWIPTGLGLVTIDRADLEAFDEGKKHRLRTRVFRKSDGLRSNDFSGGFDRPALRARDGSLVFATTRGLAIVDPDSVPANGTPPRIHIEEILADGVRWPGGPIEVSPSQRRIEIAYSAPSYRSPEGMTFSYRLEGFDDEWREAGNRRTAYYTNLPPGRYRFVVRARTRDAAAAETSTSFEIAPQLYETWQFKLAAGLMLVLVAVMVHRRRVDALHRHKAELQRSEEHFRSLIENGSDMILVIAADGTVSYVSPSIERILGLHPGEMHERAVVELLTEPDSVGRFLAEVRAHGRHAALLVFRDASGGEREIESVGAACGDDGRVILNCRDVTDRRRLERQLEQANRLSGLGRLAATVSHEFNNVLMGIQPFVDIIRRKTDERGIEHAAMQIARSVDRGKRISEQILRYTRPADPALRAVAARAWLLDLELEIRALAGPNVRVAIVAPQGLALDGDVAQLNQVLTNLAINARDAGATDVTIEAREVEQNGVFSFGIIREPANFVHLIVRDNGSGIPASVMPKIFEPLFTTKTTRGTGLGLAVAQQVIVRHGGEIFVESRVGHGTSFHLFLRRATGEVTEGETLAEQGGRPGECRVLLVEDDTTVAAGLLALLESEGFSAELAVNGGDALHRLSHAIPDVVVLDVGLPDIGGIELYQRIKRQWPRLPVVFSTGHADVADLHEKLPPPHPPFLLKPYEIDTLVEAIGTVLRERVVTSRNDGV